MLLQLEIQNIALIDRVGIELGKGLNILTGETGAGKSIIIDSINAVLGERISKELIRSGRDKAFVQAVFMTSDIRVHNLLENLGIEFQEDDNLIISREFSISGRNICRINGNMVTVGTLKELGQYLIDVHGQHDNQSLLRTESHIELLDLFAGVKLHAIKLQYSNLLKKYRDIKSKIKSLSGDKIERERKIDLLKYQIDEIKDASLKPGEEEELDRKRKILSSAEKILSALSRAYSCLYSDSDTENSALDFINSGISELHGIAGIDEKYQEIFNKMEEISYQTEDVADVIRRERDAVEYNPELLDEIGERLDLIFRLKKKYGGSIKEILEYYTTIENELDEMISSEGLLSELFASLNEIDNQLISHAMEISELRKSAALILETKVGNELDELEMKKSQMKVTIEFNNSNVQSGERKYTDNGLDTVEFLISANVGEPLKPLAKIASGGEMSRVMLAIKTILADVDEVPTLIFDEIDSGISGIAAQKVGEKLNYISKSHQVISVTHLAQIACMADWHFLIQKFAKNDSTFSKVDKMSDMEIDSEIARIIGGANISEITMKHAQEMLENARSYKKQNINPA